MKTVEAHALSVHFSEKCYTLRVEIVDGPAAMVGRVVRVELSSAELNSICEWEPGTETSVLVLNQKQTKQE